MSNKKSVFQTKDPTEDLKKKVGLNCDVFSGCEVKAGPFGNKGPVTQF